MANANRIKEDIETLRGITQPCAFGTQRPSYTPEYLRGVDYVRNRMEAFGLAVREDGIGNLYGLLEGTEPAAPKIISGSHLDSVKCSGAFDGIAGVVCALEAARMIKESGQPLRHPFEVMGTIGEEGTRFGKVLIGSSFVAGRWGEAELDSFHGVEDGLSLRDAMKRYGLSGDLTGVCRKDEPVKAFLELHAEQGPIMEEKDISIGVVENIVAISWLEVKVKGLASHPGTIPMKSRRDAGIGAFQLICRANAYATERYNGCATITTGRLQLLPGSTNCIPSECNFTMDIRTGKDEYRNDLIRFVKEQIPEIERDYRVEIELVEAVHQDPIAMNATMQGYIEQSAAQRGYSSMRISSGAGHDAMIFRAIWPTAMIFLKSIGGLTHHPDECIPYEEMAKGADVIYDVLRALDAQPD